MNAPIDRAKAENIARKGQAAFLGWPRPVQIAVVVFALLVLMWIWNILSSPVAQAKLGFGVVLILLFSVPIILLLKTGKYNGGRRMGGSEYATRKEREEARKAGYMPPVEWINYHDTPSSRVNDGDYAPFTFLHSVLEERSILPQFQVWYYTTDYIGRKRGEADTAGGEWVSVIDGNPRLGTDVSKMPIFIQKPIFDPKTKRTRLPLLVITPEQVSRLKGGPLRQESFVVTELSTKRRAEIMLSVGVLGGRWRDNQPPLAQAQQPASPPGPGVQPGPAPGAGTHGTAQPGGLSDMEIPR